MTESLSTRQLSDLPRISSGITGLDAVLGGGLPQNRTVLIAGQIGSGKTTLANHLAFHHARNGGNVVVVSFLAESHDVLLDNLRAFQFFQEDLVGGPIQYLNVLTQLVEGGIDAVLDTVRREVRDKKATLLVIEGTSILEDISSTPFDLRQFAQRTEGLCSMLGCTGVLLTSHIGDNLRLLGGSVNGVVLLSHATFGRRRVRLLEILKMRGVAYATGEHEFEISPNGVEVYPRLESLVGRERPQQLSDHGLGTGSNHIDTMMGGGLRPLSITMITGTPGAGKTILGLSFIVEGAIHGERGLIVGFHEREGDLVSTAQNVGRNLRAYLDKGIVKVVWNASLELSADAWAWQVLNAVTEHGAQRVFIDALTDVQRVMTTPERTPAFVTALSNELRARGATVMMSTEIESYTDTSLKIPIPAVSASTDAGIFLRHVELNGRIRRMISILKVRQSASDPVIQEMEITNQGIIVMQPFKAVSGVLTGRAIEGSGES